MTVRPICNTVIVDNSWSIKTPTALLRFVMRDGHRVLQQSCKIEHNKNGVSYEWMDVPMEIE